MSEDHQTRTVDGAAAYAVGSAIYANGETLYGTQGGLMFPELQRESRRPRLSRGDLDPMDPNSVEPPDEECSQPVIEHPKTFGDSAKP